MRYWHDTGRAGPEERITERLALAQIWPRLRPKDRELLAAMAEHEDYGKAAAALGKTRHTYATEIGRAPTAVTAGTRQPAAPGSRRRRPGAGGG
jgi:hypothetical protein